MKQLRIGGNGPHTTPWYGIPGPLTCKRAEAATSSLACRCWC